MKLLCRTLAVEVANALLIAVRRGRIGREKASRFFLDLRALPFRLDPESGETVFDQVFQLAEKYSLRPTMPLILN